MSISTEELAMYFLDERTPVYDFEYEDDVCAEILEQCIAQGFFPDEAA